MKKLLLVAALFTAVPVFAAEKALPDKVSHDETLELENYELKIANINRTMNELKQTGEALVKKHEVIWAKYSLGRDDRVGADGAITRAPKTASKKK